MKFIWASGYTREVLIPANLIGISNGGKRPTRVELTHSDMKNLMTGLRSKDPVEAEKTMRYLTKIATALSIIP